MAAIIVCEESCWLKLYFVGGDISFAVSLPL